MPPRGRLQIGTVAGFNLECMAGLKSERVCIAGLICNKSPAHRHEFGFSIDGAPHHIDRVCGHNVALSRQITGGARQAVKLLYFAPLYRAANRSHMGVLTPILCAPVRSPAALAGLRFLRAVGTSVAYPTAIGFLINF